MLYFSHIHLFAYSNTSYEHHQEIFMDERLEQEVNLLHAHICQGIADPKRILILYALADQPKYVSELAEQLNIPQPTISRHLKVLRERSLVTTEREGAAVYYSLTDERVIQALDLLRALLADILTQQAELAQIFN
jgi:ArsR family transcriptional regulator